MTHTTRIIIMLAIAGGSLAASAQTDLGPLANDTQSATAEASLTQAINDALNLDRSIIIDALWDTFRGTRQLDPTDSRSFVSNLYRRIAVESLARYRPPDRPWYTTTLERDKATTYEADTVQRIETIQQVISEPVTVRIRPTATPTATTGGTVQPTPTPTRSR
jgi:hypothetical protein